VRVFVLHSTKISVLYSLLVNWMYRGMSKVNEIRIFGQASLIDPTKWDFYLDRMNFAMPVRIGVTPGTYTLCVGNINGPKLYIMMEVLRVEAPTTEVAEEMFAMEEEVATFTKEEMKSEQEEPSPSLSPDATHAVAEERDLQVQKCFENQYNQYNCGTSGGRVVCWQYDTGQFASVCICPDCELNPPEIEYTCGNCARGAWNCNHPMFSCGLAGEVRYCRISNGGGGSVTDNCATLTGHVNQQNYCGDCR